MNSPGCLSQSTSSLQNLLPPDALSLSQRSCSLKERTYHQQECVRMMSCLKSWLNMLQEMYMFKRGTGRDVFVEESPRMVNGSKFATNHTTIWKSLGQGWDMVDKKCKYSPYSTVLIILIASSNSTQLHIKEVKSLKI